MAKINKVKLKKLNLKIYISLLKNCFIHPKLFLQDMVHFSFKQALILFIINAVLGLSLRTIISVFYFQNWIVLLISITEIILSLPILLLLLFLLTLFLYLLAKVLQGQADFKTSLKVICFSAFPLVLFSLPFILPILIIYTLYYLIFSFHKVHNYSLIRASINILVPFLIVALFIFMLGIAHSFVLLIKPQFS